MTRSSVYAVPGERYALVRGPLGMAMPGMGIRGQWDAIEHGWWVRSDVVSDLLTECDIRSIDILYREHRAPRYKPRRPRR